MERFACAANIADVTRNQLASAIFERSHLTGNFVLRSGATATEYFDKYQFEADPELLAEICEALAPLVPPDTEMLAGLELGGVPLAVVLGQITGLPVLFVRKEAKTYGTERLAEGGEITGKRLLVVEDVVTSGGQVVLSTADLRGAGAVISDVVCVIDRSEGGTEALTAEGLTLRSVVDRADLERAGVA